jgi:hypothetical protein
MTIPRPPWSPRANADRIRGTGGAKGNWRMFLWTTSE